MTIDDDSSIYVGGLPYTIGEESLRKVFCAFGAVLAVKIINDRATGGKCYGFVTFANPRSATRAIKEMDGKTIDGRVVKVNDVRTRGGRTNFNRDSFQRDAPRGFSSDRDRDHGRNDSQYRHSHRRNGYRETSLDYDQDKERDQSHVRSHDRIKDLHLDEERFLDYDSQMDGVEKELERKREREWERDSDENIEERRNGYHKTGLKDKQQDLCLVTRSGFDNHANRELLSESFNDQDQIESELAISSQNLEEVRMEISHIRGVAADQQVVVSELHAKCEKLEDSLIAAKKLTSHRHQQLANLHKAYLQVRDCVERLKNSEQELQLLVESTSRELGKDGGIVDATN